MRHKISFILKIYVSLNYFSTMKKFISSYKSTVLYLVIAVLICPFALTSCSDDDGDSVSSSNIVGTWVGDDYDTFYSNVTITFNSNGTGSATIERHGGYTSIYRGQFTYKLKGNKVTTKGTLANANSDGDTSTQSFNNTYQLNGSTLTVVSGNTWYTMRVKSYKKR